MHHTLTRDGNPRRVSLFGLEKHKPNNSSKTTNTMKQLRLQDKVMISPELTHREDWLEGTVIDVEDNPFQGVVISAETPDHFIYFGRVDAFRAV